MRVLLTANASYVPPRGGATRSNLVWLDQLAASGHECRVVAAALAEVAGKSEQLRTEELAAPEKGDGIEIARRGAIAVYSAADPARRSRLLREQIAEFRPDWVLVSSEDIGQVLLREAHRSAPGRVVYLAHTPQFFPFGPASWNPDAHAPELLRACAGVVAISRTVAGYVRRHTGAQAAVSHPPIYGSGPFRRYGAFDRGSITIINPCAVKGISIFLAVAEQMPEYPFAALIGWGTTRADRAALERLPNVTLLPNCRDIEDVLRVTRALLMPSLWFEGFGLIAMEAMLRGIPVVASDAGGLVEAKLGTGFVIPVRPIERYEAGFDERGMPVPVLPQQEIAPWLDALRELLSDRAVYEREAEASREAALRFVENIRPGALAEFLGTLAPPMRILLAHNSTYWPGHGGGDRSNRLLMEALAARGHACRAVARTAAYGPEEHRRYLADLAARGVQPVSSDGGVVVLRLGGVEVHTVTSSANLRAYFAGQVAAFDPDVILASTDDPAGVLLESALKSERARVVYLVRATLAVPFGPDCAFPSESKKTLLAQCDAVVGVSRYVAEYVRRWSGIEAVHVPISLVEPGPDATLGRIDNEFVTLVNPCAVKGLPIFLGLADTLPEVRFAAVPTWGTNESDRAALRARPNITVLDPVDDIDQLLARTRVLLVPSLWAEARSRIVVEAMLRGVPVLASDVGGIPEAKLGVPYLLPVRPIQHYQPKLDEQMVPVAEVPEQDIAPWREALEKLLGDPRHYGEISGASREAALAYVGQLSIEPFESVLRKAVRSPRQRAATPLAAPPPQSALEKLSPEKRHLLALKLRKKAAAAGEWFPSLEWKAENRLRLFCFPHAGAGATAFHGWSTSLPGAVALAPVRLPGRESRVAEPPADRMERLVEALAAAIRPNLDRPYAFFGHSMGAAIAFELARRLRRDGVAMPAALLVSGARAPQFRRNWSPPPDPTDDELVEQLRRLEGVPQEVFENPDLLRVILPALRADTALYRNYVYTEEPPLACPIRAYGGLADPNVARQHLQGWREQTACSFALRLFAGGHFFIVSARTEFLDALARDLTALNAAP